MCDFIFKGIVHLKMKMSLMFFQTWIIFFLLWNIKRRGFETCLCDFAWLIITVYENRICWVGVCVIVTQCVCSSGVFSVPPDPDALLLDPRSRSQRRSESVRARGETHTLITQFYSFYLTGCCTFYLHSVCVWWCVIILWWHWSMILYMYLCHCESLILSGLK